jgi:hypothetical protein
MARTLAAFAAVEYVDEGLFGAVADALTPRLRAGLLQPRVLSKLAGALAGVGAHDATVFRDIAAAVVAAAAGAAAAAGPAAKQEGSSEVSHQVLTLPGYQPRDVCTLVWALATAGFSDLKPYQVLAAAGVQLMPAMSAGQVASLLWGCAVAGLRAEPLLAAAVDRLTMQPMQQQQQQSLLAAATAADVASIAWSLTKLQVWEPSVLDTCAVHFRANRQQYSPADAADLIWALAWSAGQPVCVSDTPGLAQQQQQQQDGADEQQGMLSRGFEQVQVLQQLLDVCESDLDALSPQQLVNVGLVAAALQSGCLIAPTPPAAAAPAAAGAEQGDMSAGPSKGAESRVVGSKVSGQQLWANVVSWGPTAFTAADGVKLLHASLLGLSQLPPPPQQQKQQQQKQQGRAGTQAASSKLLASGVRALVHQTAAVCSSTFCLQVLSALQAQGLQAWPCSSAAVEQGTTDAGQSSSTVLASRAGQSGGMHALQGSARSAAGAAATAAAASSAATAVATALAPAAAAAAAAGNSPGNSAAAGSTWDQLGLETVALLLGHIVVDLPTSTGPSADQHPAEDQHKYTSMDRAPLQTQQQTRPVLLRLVPSTDVCRPLQQMPTGCDTGGAGAPSPSGGVAGTIGSAVQLSWQAVVSGHVLQQQPLYVGVTLTQQDWEAWGDLKLQKLQALLSAAEAAASSKA